MTELATQELARARAARIRAGIGAYLATLADVAAAYQQRDWQALGYADWQSYVDGEYSEHKLRLSPEHRQKAVAELRLAGMSQRAIGSALGVSVGTVNADLSGVQDRTPDAIQGADGKSYAATRPSQPARPPVEEPSPGSAASPLGSVDASEAPTVGAVGAGETAAGNDTWPADGAGDPHPPAPALAAPVEGAGAAGVTLPDGVFEDMDSALEAIGVTPAIREFLDDDPAVRAAEFMERFSTALSRAGAFMQFDAARVAELASPTTWAAIEAHAEVVAHYYERARKARRTLRVLPGGAA